MTSFEAEIAEGQRFTFGENWKSFLLTVTETRIEIAQASLTEMLGVQTLKGKTFLDVGSGSGLFSLAARILGADVCSFDYDPGSVACTNELRSRYFPDDPAWVVKHGSVLDDAFIASLGTFDVVYAWGVLHHTGAMWRAMKNVACLVREGGTLFTAIYNDQGRKSRLWRSVKSVYCSGLIGKAIVSGVFIPLYFLKTVVSSVRKRQNIFRNYKRNRGMSIVHDWHDWLGGLPFEVATAEAVVMFFKARGFVVQSMRTSQGSSGNNQFVFGRD